jgi:Family of unknown function (DUF6504)
MTHAYRQPIAVTPDADGRPVAFDWRGVGYRVLAVLATWHLRDRWWEEGTAGTDGPDGGASDRTYYRLQCASASGRTELVCEVYHDAVGDRWVLERVYD